MGRFNNAKNIISLKISAYHSRCLINVSIAELFSLTIILDFLVRLRRFQ